MNKSHVLVLLCLVALFITSYKLLETKQKVKQISQSLSSPKEAILSVIHNRKSVRVYANKTVSKDDLITIMKAGMAAPSGMDKRPWKFIALTDTIKIHELKQETPAAIVVCGDMNKVDDRAPEFWITDTSVATENMLLAIEAMGLGAVWKSVYPWKDYTEHVKKTLQLPDYIEPLCIITLGYPTGVEKPKDKFDAKNIRWETW